MGFFNRNKHNLQKQYYEVQEGLSILLNIDVSSSTYEEIEHIFNDVELKATHFQIDSLKANSETYINLSNNLAAIVEEYKSSFM